MATPLKALLSSDLPPGQSACVTLAGKKIALFRESDGVYAMDDECPHRGGSLSQGWVTEGKVACPLHQWQFNLKDGQCPMVKTAKVSVYPVEIRDGEIWIHL